MKPREYFPLGKAYGNSFCNRIEETEKLIGNILNGKHTFLVAPRRYGKSSLCERVFVQAGLAWTKTDFHLAITEKDAERFIVNSVIDLIGKAIGQVDKLQSLISQFVKTLTPRLTLGGEVARLELEINVNRSPAENIAEAILLLDRLLIEKNKRAIMLLDEFQEVGQIAKGRGIEGAIRSAAQETKKLALIFSGSSPHLIQNMFEDERRPLYKLCRKLTLPRISVEHYKAHLDKVAQLSWKKNLPNEVFERIMLLSQRHPHYVNYLCDIVWSESKKMPTVEIVNKAWQQVIEEEHSDIIKEFLDLPENQRKIMKYIATQENAGIYSNQAAKNMDIPSGSIRNAIEFLIEKDFIKAEGEGKKTYRLINPLYEKILKE
jgi:hypothetical protein